MVKGPGTEFEGKDGKRVLWPGPDGKLRPFPDGTPNPSGKGCASMILVVVGMVSLMAVLASRLW